MYNCNQCLKTYSWRDSLTRHVRIKHGDVEEAMDMSTTGRSTVLRLSDKPIEFQHPFTMTISGPTGSGKTFLLKHILQHGKVTPSPQRIVYLYKRWQPLYSDMLDTIKNIEFVQGIPTNLDSADFFDVRVNNMVICDDLMTVASIDPKVADLFTEGSHHRNLSVINLTQNLFPPGRNAVTQRRNTQYMIIFNSPMGQDQIRTFGTFMFPGRLKQFLDVYQIAAGRPHGYLVIDAKQATPEVERLKTDIFRHKLVKAKDADIKYFCENCKYCTADEELFDSHTCGDNNLQMTNSTIPGTQPQQNAQLRENYATPKRIGNIKSHSDQTGNDIKEHPQPSVNQLSSNLQANSMDKPSDVHSCVECGAVYDSPEALYKHIKVCDSGSSCSSENHSESGWEDLVQEVYDDNDDLYQSRVRKYERRGYKDATQRAAIHLLPTYKADLQRKFSRIFIHFQQLEQNENYEQMARAYHYYLNDKKYSKSKSVRAVVRANSAFFDELLDDDPMDNDDEDDDNDDSGSDMEGDDASSDTSEQSDSDAEMSDSVDENDEASQSNV